MFSRIFLISLCLSTATTSALDHTFSLEAADAQRLVNDHVKSKQLAQSCLKQLDKKRARLQDKENRLALITLFDIVEDSENSGHPCASREITHIFKQLGKIKAKLSTTKQQQFDLLFLESLKQKTELSTLRKKYYKIVLNSASAQQQMQKVFSDKKKIEANLTEAITGLKSVYTEHQRTLTRSDNKLAEYYKAEVYACGKMVERLERRPSLKNVIWG